MICIRSFLQEIRFLSLSYWWWCLFMFPLESPFPFFILHVHLCYELNDFLFLFFSCCFWWSYNNIVAGICQYIFCVFMLLFLFICFVRCLYFIICLYFLLFSVNLCYCEVVKNGMVCCERTVGKDGRGGWGFGGLVLLRLRGFC